MKYLFLFLFSGLYTLQAQVEKDSLFPNTEVTSIQTDTILGLKNELLDPTMTLSEFLSYVRKFHPIVKQANLIITESDVKRLKSRGAFDPKLEVDYDTKQFKSKEYYDKLNASFKVPVWYGIGVKANYENNDGDYLNPENNVPNNGLYGLGITASIGGGMFMNERMAAVKQAKNYQKQALEERKILVNKILFDAANTYFDWLQFYNEKNLQDSFLLNSELRFTAIKSGFISGEMAAIDTLEANITVNNRKLNLEKSTIKYLKSTLQLSTYLWLENNIPVELNSVIAPDTLTINKVDAVLKTPIIQTVAFDIKDHPKLKALSFKAENLEIDRKLKFNNLLPKIDAQYNFISESFGDNDALGFDNYKAGVKVSVPIFLRKERSDLKLAKIKIEALNYERTTQEITISNKIIALQQELVSFEKQIDYSTVLVKDYNTLFRAEQRKFILGESSVFYVNIRESKLMESELKYIKLINSFFKTKAKLYNSLVIY
jgi:outer membrane protein TolC